MSGSPNIGLLGSKDATKELRKDAKDDSDLETYDTEALSIMDINDIIGVQSEPVSDSTLESEIAALSRMITESKTDGIQNVMEAKPEDQEEVPKSQETSNAEDVDAVRMSDTLEELENICDMEKITCASDVEQLNEENLRLSDAARNEEDVNMSIINRQEDRRDVVTINKKVTSVESDINICGSLQLIGEAYSSEDSQESDTNDIELKTTDASATSNEKSSIPCEKEKETSESCELQHIVNNLIHMSDSINSDKSCINKDVSAVRVETEAHSIEVNASNCSTEHKCVEALSDSLEDKGDIVPNECKVDNPKNTAPECKKEEVNEDIAGTDDTEKESLQEERTDNVEIIEENEAVDSCNVKMNEGSGEPVDDTCTLQEVKILEGNTEMETHQESVECMDIEKEGTDESEYVSKEKEMEQEDKEHVNTLNTENAGDNNDSNITQKENESEPELPQCHSENVDDPTVSESRKSDFLDTVVDSEVLKNKADALELPEKKQEVDIENLKSTEEVHEDSSQSVTSQLESDQCLAANSREDPMSPSHTHMEYKEVNTDVEAEDNKKEDLAIAETETTEVSVDESVGATELSEAEEKSESELTTLNSETFTRCETPLEIELNLDSVACVSQSQAVSNVTVSMDTTDDSSTNKINSLEENSDEVRHEVEMIDAKSLKVNEYVEEQSEESREVMDKITEEIKAEETSSVADISEECAELNDSEVSEKHVDVSLTPIEESKVETKEESSSSKLCSEYERAVEKETSELKEHEDICKVDEEEGSKQAVKDDVLTVLQTEENVEADETKDSVKNEDQISDFTSDKNDPTSVLDDAALKISEEIAREDTEEEANLSLESEGTELQPEESQDSLEQNSEKEDATKAVEINNKDQQSYAAAMDNVNVDSLDVEKSVVSEEASTGLQENELDMYLEETPLESVGDLDESESKLELALDILLQNVDQGENLNDPPTGMETSQPSSEISELESAVKFLQESEEQAIDSPLVLSPKIVECVENDMSKQADASSLFVPDEDMCEDASELVVDLQDIATDSISISEAEIISEAAKLESEKKLAEQVKMNASMDKFKEDEDKLATDEEKIKVCETEDKFEPDSLQHMEAQQASNFESAKISETIVTLSKNVFKTSESIPKVSILEERLKEPPKIEIPTADMTKVSVSPATSNDNLLIQKDAKLIAYQKMLESPKLSEKSEPKIMDTPRKDSEKHEFENVGSPRIILKIAKSAITDCGEPRSPKSPKIRSATNSPNPEDSPGQKLGKIKLKLSKGGHPSIISNENVEEAGQWYSEGSSSLSPIGMKIKLSKSGDASIVPSEKHEFVDDSKEVKHKFEEVKRTESPIGMKIKLSKSGDASIVQQDSKDMQMKHKDKLDMVQGSPKRTESPIGMKIKLSKSGDVSIIQAEKQDPLEEHRDNAQLRPKEKLEAYDSPKRTDSPIGMKIKLSKSGDVSIVSPDMPEDSKEMNKAKDKVDSSPEIPKRTESPVGMKIKLAKTKGGASIIPMENSEDVKEKLEIPDIPKRTESPLGMKIKLSKTGDASIVHSEISEEVKDVKQKERVEGKEKSEVGQDTMKSSDTTSSMKIKVIKSGETSVVAQESMEKLEAIQESSQKVESSIGVKIKLSKFGDASIVSTEKQEQLDEIKSFQEVPKRTESPLGMKIKLSKTGDASIIQTETSEDVNKMARVTEVEPKTIDAGLGMKIKLLKTGDAAILESEKKERHQRRRDAESPLEMKIKLSKTGHPTIVACENHGELAYKPKEVSDQSHSFSQRYKDSVQTVHKEPALKILKTAHSTILQSNRSELTIEPIQMQSKKADNAIEISPKRKEITIAPIEPKKSKLETQLTQILPEVTIQPVTSRDQKQFVFDPKNSAISLQQMNVISQEISITQVRPSKPQDTMNEKLKDILNKNTTGSPINSDCEIIEHRPELIIVNENSNSSQDVVIIEEVSSNRMPEVKVPKKRGRPRRNPIPQATIHPSPHLLMSRDPLSVEEIQQMQQPQAPHSEPRENERPKRTCRSQKSYAPPKRGRGRGRGKRKLDSVDLQMIKKPRVDQDLSAIEASTTAVITIDEPSIQQPESFGKSPELYKALKQPVIESKISSMNKIEKKAMAQKNDALKIIAQKNDGSKTASVPNSAPLDPTSTLSEATKATDVGLELSKMMPKPVSYDSKDNVKDKKSAEVIPEKIQKVAPKSDEKADKAAEIAKPENRETLVPPGHSNWLTPISKRPGEVTAKQESVSTVQVIDEETRMSAESNSRSQTPARNISAPASETIINEESQGSVLSTATTESEKVKVKNRRMEINFDPDEGPFTVDKIAEYEWPLDRKGETFMIQEQISQYLGVKSFKRKYPDLKRRVVDMEERNYLRENGLVSEAMCDMGLTAICSSEVLDVMCSDFPDQYEEYRKHMREKQVKEHSKKQKELTAAANAEKNRIDLAEMAVQSALAWNISLNKARRETRKCSLDLQTFTIHVPKKQQKLEAERKIGHYPVALIPGQYTDYYREYTPAELRYYPLNTVLYGPMRPNERKFDSQSEGSQSDSDSDSSSDDSSSSSSEGTQDTEGSQSTMDEVDMEIVNQKDEVKLKCKMCLKTLNKHSKNEVLIQCGTCNGHVHPSCIDLTLDMVPHIQSYAWQCTDCKTCAQCHDPADEDKMLFCDMCDRGYHIYCVGLRRVPQGRWHCQECAVCANCSSREPGGVNSDRNSVAQWQHEYKKGDKNTRVYVSTLCVPCSKLWRKGRYCPHCSRCHTAPRLDLEANLVHCSACDKYLHLGCVETKGIMLDRKNYLCDFCAPNRQQVVKPLISKTLKI